MDNTTLWPLIEAANHYAMPLVRAEGGPGTYPLPTSYFLLHPSYFVLKAAMTRPSFAGADKEGEYIVYVYDSLAFPFFRGEAHHQFHTNDVIGR